MPIALVFPSGLRVSDEQPANDRFISADWTGAASLPPYIQTDVDWDVAAVIDRDAPYPDRNSFSPYLHWIVKNGPKDGRRLETVVEWMPMSPPVDSPPHLYQLVLFRQAPGSRSRGLWASYAGRRPPRQNFNLGRFAADWDLTKVGQLDYRSARGISKLPRQGGRARGQTTARGSDQYDPSNRSHPSGRSDQSRQLATDDRSRKVATNDPYRIRDGSRRVGTTGHALRRRVPMRRDGDNARSLTRAPTDADSRLSFSMIDARRPAEGANRRQSARLNQGRWGTAKPAAQSLNRRQSHLVGGQPGSRAGGQRACRAGGQLAQLAGRQRAWPAGRQRAWLAGGQHAWLAGGQHAWLASGQRDWRVGGLAARDCRGFVPFRVVPGYDKPCRRLVREGMTDDELTHACSEQRWFGMQEPAPSGRVCLGFQRPPPESDCEKHPDNIDCYLQRHPHGCNYLEHDNWSNCINELYLTCLERGKIAAEDRPAQPIWVTDPAHVERRRPNPFVTQNEACHWFQQTGKWPRARAI